MNLLPLDQLGSRETTPGTIEFSFILPGITPANGYAVIVRIIHSLDQLRQVMEPVEVVLKQAPPIAGYDAWVGSVTPLAPDAPPGSHWGEPGQYVYCVKVTGP